MRNQHRDFRPLPFLGNPHLQTVLGNLLAWPRDRHVAHVRRVVLPDDDALAVHDTTPPAWLGGQPIAVLVHGLGGDHRSPYMRRIANRLTAAGTRVVRVDLRGSGAGLKLARRFYNAACSADIRAVLAMLHADAPTSPLLLAGFSLGGNIVLKLAGEAAELPVPGLIGVAAVAPPIDLVQCSAMISRLRFYDRYYVRKLIAQVHQHARHFPELPRVAFPARATLRDFDHLYTAPRWGYADALDYYRRASSLPWLSRIVAPTLIVTARDDPFVAVGPFVDAAPPVNVTIDVVERGGHLGFLGGDGQGGVRWAESRVVRWLLDEVRRCQTREPRT